MKTVRLILLTFLVLNIAACQGGDGDDSLVGTANQDELLQPLQDAVEDESISIDRKLIKTAYVGFEVDDIKSTETKIRKNTFDHGGYITNENQFTSDDRLNYSFEIRVPNANFRSMMMSIAQGVEEFESKRIDVQDVTEEFIDVKARIKTKKEVEQRYVSLLSHAYTVEEILLIEAQLKEIREEIESFEGRMKYLKNSISFSTIHLTIFEEVTTNSHFGDRFGDSFVDGWKGFVYFLIILTQLWPFYILTAIIIGLVRYRKKKKIALK